MCRIRVGTFHINNRSFVHGGRLQWELELHKNFPEEPDRETIHDLETIAKREGLAEQTHESHPKVPENRRSTGIRGNLRSEVSVRPRRVVS